MSAFCEWYDKDTENVTEYEQEQCKKYGQNCFECMHFKDAAVPGIRGKNCTGCSLDIHDNTER